MTAPDADFVARLGRAACAMIDRAVADGGTVSAVYLMTELDDSVMARVELSAPLDEAAVPMTSQRLTETIKLAADYITRVVAGEGILGADARDSALTFANAIMAMDALSAVGSPQSRGGAARKAGAVSDADVSDALARARQAVRDSTLESTFNAACDAVQALKQLSTWLAAARIAMSKIGEEL